MLLHRVFDRDREPTPLILSLRCWCLRIVWPACLVLLLVCSLPRITTLSGLVYLIVIDMTGIAAGLHGAEQLNRMRLRRQAEPTPGAPDA